ncbi:MAG: alginate export family protein [Salinivirgaceae bacterium]
MRKLHFFPALLLAFFALTLNAQDALRPAEQSSNPLLEQVVNPNDASQSLGEADGMPVNNGSANEISNAQTRSVLPVLANEEPKEEKKDSWGLNLELRPRTEFRNGYKALTTATSQPAFLTTQRSRLGVSYENDKIKSNFAVQDVRTWGDVKTKADAPSLMVFEAWMEMKLHETLALKVGRQQLKYEQQHLLATTNWNNVATSHDLALLKFRKSGFDVHLGLAYNNDAEKNYESNYPVDHYKAMQFLWLSKKFDNGFALSLLEITEGLQPATADYTLYFRNTTGLHIDYSNKDLGLTLSGAGYLQSGKDKNGTNLNSHLILASASYQATEKLKASVGFEFYSGDNALDSLDTEKNAFNNLYGAGHALRGSMDYFLTVDNHTDNGGLMDLYLKLDYNLNDKISTSAAYHYFSLANNVIDTEYTGTEIKALDKPLGSEIDLLLNYKYHKTLTMSMGYSVMFAQRSLAVIRGGDYEKAGHWFFVMLTFKPSLLFK